MPQESRHQWGFDVLIGGQLCDCEDTLTLRLSEVAFLDARTDRSVELVVEDGRRGGGGFVIC